MKYVPPNPEPEGPLPVFAVLAVILPLLFTVVPFCMGMADSGAGSFRLLIAMHHAMVGGAIGIVFGIVCAIQSYMRKELYALWAASIFFLPVLVLLGLAFML